MRKKPFIFLTSLLILLFVSNIVSPSSPTVYILNSDQSIEKLFLAENSFKKYFSGKVKSFGLKRLDKKGNNLYKIIKPTEQDLIYCIGSRSLSFALKTYPKNRIIFSSVINWKRFDISKLTYGVSGEVPVESQLTIFKHVFPSIKKVGIIYSPKYNQEWIDQTQIKAKAFNLKLVSMPIKNTRYSDKAFAELFPLVDAVWLIPDPNVITRGSFFKIVKQGEEKKKPLLTYSSVFVENGAVLAVSVDDETVGRQTAVLIERLIQEKTIEEKIQMPTGSYITLNMKKVKEFKLKINPGALGNINRIIE